MLNYLKKRLLRFFNSILKRFFGYRLNKIEIFSFNKNFPDTSLHDTKLMNICSKYFIISFDNIFFLIKAINYVCCNKVKGDFVECEVWWGGNLILLQKMLSKLNLTKKMYAFHNF